MNEIFLIESSRARCRSIHRGEGWTPQTIAEHGMPSLKSSLLQARPLGGYFQLEDGCDLAGRAISPHDVRPGERRDFSSLLCMFTNSLIEYLS